MSTDARVPEVAVVIPSRNREARLAFALQALAEQTLDAARFEVIVVRSQDAGRPHAEAPPELDVRFLIHRGEPGPGAQRNTGWRAARAPLIAFTDDDCRPHPRWLERLLEASDGDETFVQGRTEPDPDERHLLIGLARTLVVDRPNDWYATCNMAYPTALLRCLGGFDESFVFSAEDADLGIRARGAGARRVFEHRALVWHAVLPESLPGAIVAAVARDQTPLLISRHPGQRRALYGRVFWKREHAALLLALTGVLVFRRRPALALVAALPYLNRHLDWRRLATATGAARAGLHLTARAAIDLTELAVTIRGAIRHRVLLL